jgi:allantoate deiminase
MNDERAAALASEALARCDVLARCSLDSHRINRPFCTPPMREVHRLVTQWMQAAGMVCRVDAAGNFFGRYEPPGCDQARRVVVGSHLDTVVDAGRYDGILGVVIGIATVAALRESGGPLPWAVEVVGFSDEEGVRYKAPFLGSRALAGSFPVEVLQLVDGEGITMAQALREFGAEPLEIPRCAAQGDLVAYLEAHIEQGPLLEMLGAPLSVVTAIAGQTRLTVEWTGEGGHAGTVPMQGRSDAFTVACRWALAAERLAQDTAGLVATVGRIDVEPNVPNCIPRRVCASLDIRHQGDAVRVGATRVLVELADQLARDSRLGVRVEYDHEHAAVAMDAGLCDVLTASLESLGFLAQQMVSGAGHDAGVMAAIAPAGLLFLRSPGGVSHHPDEAVMLADVAAAIRVMVDCMGRIARDA